MTSAVDELAPIESEHEAPPHAALVASPVPIVHAADFSGPIPTVPTDLEP